LPFLLTAQGRAVLYLDLGYRFKKSDKAKHPCFHPGPDTMSRAIYLSRPATVFPYSKTVNASSPCERIPIHAQPLEKLNELWLDLIPALKQCNVYHLDPSLSSAVRLTDPLNTDLSLETRQEIWGQIIQILSRLESCFCAIDLAMLQHPPDPIPWRALSHLLGYADFPDIELFRSRDAAGFAETQAYIGLKQITRIINQFHGWQVMAMLIVVV
jgi:hypothetical protein